MKSLPKKFQLKASCKQESLPDSWINFLIFPDCNPLSGCNCHFSWRLDIFLSLFSYSSSSKSSSSLLSAKIAQFLTFHHFTFTALTWIENVQNSFLRLKISIKWLRFSVTLCNSQFCLQLDIDRLECPCLYWDIYSISGFYELCCDFFLQNKRVNVSH